MLDDLDSMLDEAITAHEAKDFNSAAAKYTKILERDAHHADANHNFGLLTVELGLKDEALIFLQTAINTNPKVLQYWVTFIDTLTNVERFDDAKSVLEQAHLFGFREEIFDQLRHNLDLKRQLCEPLIELERVNPAETVFDQVGQKLGVLNEPITGSKKSEQDQTSILGELKLDQALKLAKKKIKDGEYEEAKVIYEDILKKFSKNKKALEGVKSLSDKLNSKKTIIQEPPQNQTRMVFDLYKQGLHQEAADQTSELLKEFPNSVSLYNILGAANQGLGKLDEAAEAYNKALSIRPDYADAYNNMGTALKNQGKIEEAVAAFKKAIAIKPDYADAYWNLHGTSENITEAKSWIEKCLVAKPNHLKAKLTLSALKFYEGDKSAFNEVIKSSIKDNPHTRSIDWVCSLPKLPPLYFHRWALFDHMTDLCKKDRPFYEFGVWRGEAFRYLIKTLKKGYGFDTFQGLPDDWHNEKAGTYSSGGNVPKIKGGEFVVGKFEDTLPRFFAEDRPMASIINFDADLYSSTICALNFSKPVIDKHTILIFDEFLINKNWEQDEYKALEEFCATNDYTYEVLAISFFTKQVAVKIIGI